MIQELICLIFLFVSVRYQNYSSLSVIGAGNTLSFRWRLSPPFQSFLPGIQWATMTAPCHLGPNWFGDTRRFDDICLVFAKHFQCLKAMGMNWKTPFFQKPNLAWHLQTYLPHSYGKSFCGIFPPKTPMEIH